MGEVLEFKNIKKRFKKKEVLSNISFKIQEGEIFGLVGRSGCGKSTLLKILVGLIESDEGEIYFDGKDITKKENYLRKNTGFATQENMLIESLTIKENAVYFGKLYGKRKGEIIKRFRELLALLGLGGFENTLIKNLSGGMAKRANLLVSLIHNPKLLILDEPTTGLDSLLRKSLWTYIREINKTGTTILVTSHLLDEIEENCGEVAILKNGRISDFGTLEEYKKEFGKNKSFSQIFQEIVA